MDQAWPLFMSEARQVLGSELHYQAMLYHALRKVGVPLRQLGMNVKQWIDTPVSSLFQRLDLRKHEGYRGGFEPIPDLVIFGPAVDGDWRRRRKVETLRTMLLAVEPKASEREKGRLSPSEIMRDILKLVAHREEARHRGSDFHPVVIVVDTAPLEAERMQPAALQASLAMARSLVVGFRYVSGRDCL